MKGLQRFSPFWVIPLAASKNLILIYVLSFFFILDVGLAPLCLTTVRLLEFAWNCLLALYCLNFQTTEWFQA